MPIHIRTRNTVIKASKSLGDNNVMCLRILSAVVDSVVVIFSLLLSSSSSSPSSVVISLIQEYLYLTINLRCGESDGVMMMGVMGDG